MLESPSIEAVDAKTKNSNENELIENVSYGYFDTKVHTFPRYLRISFYS